MFPAWKFLKQYLNEQQESIVKRFLNGDEIKPEERHQLVGLIKLFNHIEDAIKRHTERPQTDTE